MKHIIFGLLLSAIWGVSQAESLVIDNTSPISFSGYDKQSASVTGSANTGFLGPLAATSTGIFSAPYWGNESGYVDTYHSGTGHTFSNGNQQQLPLGFAIMKGQTNKFGTFDYLLGFNDNYGGVADHDGFVGASIASVAPVPEPRIYAMMLAGLGLIGFSVRRRNRENFS
jgi:hypothetical protein